MVMFTIRPRKITIAQSKLMKYDRRLTVESAMQLMKNYKIIVVIILIINLC
jgi:hypothetical protein